MVALRKTIHAVVAKNRPMTARQVFYQLVSMGVIDKTEAEYKATVVRLLGEMRRDGMIPFRWIADSTRWMRKPPTWSSLEEALTRTAEMYRRSVWQDQDAYVEVWLEKDALAGVLYDVTGVWDVPLMVTRGYPSLSYLHAAAETIASCDKPAYLYYFGDYDPSGLDISRNVEEGIREFAPDAELHFQRVAVAEEQIAAWNLPTRPTKTTDSRSLNFRGESVEVDAIPPDTLRELTRLCIEQHIDNVRLLILKLAENSERDILKRMAGEVAA